MLCPDVALDVDLAVGGVTSSYFVSSVPSRTKLRSWRVVVLINYHLLSISERTSFSLTISSQSAVAYLYLSTCPPPPPLPLRKARRMVRQTVRHLQSEGRRRLPLYLGNLFPMSRGRAPSEASGRRAHLLGHCLCRRAVR